jgi:Protein of unknown function (DUF4199)
MKTSVKFGIAFALVWMIINMIVYYSGGSIGFFKLGIMINVFLLMTGIAVGLYMSKKDEGFAEGHFLADFKAAMQTGIIYTILVAGFAYLYHEKIDPSIRNTMIAERTADLHKKFPDDTNFLALQDTDPTWAGKSFDDFIENKEDNFESIFSSSSVFIAHLMGLTFFSGFYSFFVTLIFRKIVMRGPKKAS